jgi:hypothetical protein
MTKLSDTQALILSAAAQRSERIALPLPESLRGGAAAKVVGAMLAKGLLQEVDADLRRGEPVWRKTGDGHGTTLIATEAGLEAIGIEPVAASAVASVRNAKPQKDADPAPTTGEADAPKPVTIRAGTKQAQIIALLQRPEGASIAEIVEATGWQPHTARGMISGALKKKLGLRITSAAEEGRGTVHRIG